ncbi:MAG: TRAP transporter substrate-binding protein [Deltaproteobacteria bacterium]|nr:TRAP transporter substrate-binding protein [Deltaproteobacteria bacterium]
MKKIVVLAISVCIALGVAFGVPVDKATAATVELKLAHSFPPVQIVHKELLVPWAEEVAKLSNGELKISIFPGGALGKPGDHYDLAEKGVADIIYILQDYTPGRFPLTEAFELPFMIRTARGTSIAMWKTYEKFPEFQKEYGKVKVLGLFCHDPGHFNTVKKPIKMLDDLKGMKFRTASPPVTEALKIFGAVPVSMPVPEVFNALDRGVIDGTVLPWEGNIAFRAAEPLNYGTEVDFYTMTMMVVMNQRKYDSLPANLKKIIDDTTGMLMSEKGGRIYDDSREFYKGLCLKAGMEAIQLPASERAKLRELTLPVRDQWAQQMEAKGLPGKAVLDYVAGLVGEK